MKNEEIDHKGSRIMLDELDDLGPSESGVPLFVKQQLLRVESSDCQANGRQ